MGRATLPQSEFEMQRRFRSTDLEHLFNTCFLASQGTRLVGGAAEPFYAPATPDHPATIFYTRDYFRSALHEIAHWCVAGRARRRLPDFGYWYAADGRDADQQARFQQVETRPQAFELLFCAAVGHPFRVSLDNLSGDATDPGPFEEAVWRRAVALTEQGVGGRAGCWVECLADEYRRESFRPAWLEDVFLRW
ncbi:MAG: elongation factor P hydroxylase [Alcanivoracaceae bacterium]